MIKTEANSPVTDFGLQNFGRVNFGLEAVSFGIPVVTLSNGVKVANFSSAHPFMFDDGTVLPACSSDRARTLSLVVQEFELQNCTDDGIQFFDIVLRWEMSSAVREELLRLSSCEGYDVLLVPSPVMTALKEIGLPIGRCRCVRISDRVNKLHHIDRFCI